MTKLNPTIHLTPPRRPFRSRRAPSLPAPIWVIVRDAYCPSCGADLETNGLNMQCKAYGKCDAVLDSKGRRIE